MTRQWLFIGTIFLHLLIASRTTVAQLNSTTVEPTPSSSPAQSVDNSTTVSSSTTKSSTTTAPTSNPSTESATESYLITKPTPTEPDLGRLDFDVKCTCDLTGGQCDINCCCDPDCGPESRLLFNGCWKPPRSYYDRYLCHVDPDRYDVVWNNTPEFRKEWNPHSGMFCIVTDNVPKKKVFEEKLPVKEDELFEKILPKLSGRWDDKQMTTSDLDNWIYQPFYKQGSPMFTFHINGSVGVFKLPRSLNSASCNIAKRIEFLKPENYQCDIPRDGCRPNLVIEEWLANMAVFRLPSYSANPDKNSNLSIHRWGDVDKLVPLVVRICEKQCRSDVPTPQQNCTYSLHSVILRFGYNGTEGIRYAIADLFYKAKTSGSVRFETIFESLADRQVVGGISQIRLRSGNPGYQQGKPLLAARLNSSSGEGFYQYLQVFPGSSKSRMIRFGEDSYQAIRTAGITVSNRTEWCSNWHRFVLESFWGRDLVDLRLGAFGNAELNETSLWLPIEMQTDLVCLGSTVHAKLVILYAKSGTYDQPQNKLCGVGLQIRSDRENPYYCQESTTCSLFLSQTVSFVMADSPTYMILPQPPRWKIQLPHDFFYPFLLSSATSKFSIDYSICVFIGLFIIVQCVP